MRTRVAGRPPQSPRSQGRRTTRISRTTQKNKCGCRQRPCTLVSHPASPMARSWRPASRRPPLRTTWTRSSRARPTATRSTTDGALYTRRHAMAVASRVPRVLFRAPAMSARHRNLGGSQRKCCVTLATSGCVLGGARDGPARGYAPVTPAPGGRCMPVRACAIAAQQQQPRHADAGFQDRRAGGRGAGLGDQLWHGGDPHNSHGVPQCRRSPAGPGESFIAGDLKLRGEWHRRDERRGHLALVAWPVLAGQQRVKCASGPRVLPAALS